MHEDWIAAILIDRYGWTWEEYQAQPTWLIKLLYIKMGLESEHQDRQANKQKKML